MPLEILGKMYEKANKEFYAIGQFNFSNLEFAQSAVEAAEEMKSPIILACSTGAIKYGGLENLVAITRTLAERPACPSPCTSTTAPAWTTSRCASTPASPAS